MNHQFEIEEFEDQEVEDLHYYPYPNDNILRCPNPVLIIDAFTGSHKFMVPGDYSPDKDTEYNKNSFRLLPNTVIEYKYLLDTQGIIYHLELNTVKLDNHKTSSKKISNASNVS
jgi:hypothetical protein